jgi:hypothetical protein
LIGRVSKIVCLLRSVAIQDVGAVDELLGEFVDLLRVKQFYKELNEIIDKLSTLMLHYLTKIGLEDTKKRPVASDVLSLCIQLKSKYKVPNLECVFTCAYPLVMLAADSTSWIVATRKLVAVCDGVSSAVEATKELQLNQDEVKKIQEQLFLPSLPILLSDASADIADKTFAHSCLCMSVIVFDTDTHVVIIQSDCVGNDWKAREIWYSHWRSCLPGLRSC